MRGGTWNCVKPILKLLNEHFASLVYIVYIIKPENFWQKQRTSLASHKYKFEVIFCCIQVNYISLKLYFIFMAYLLTFD